MSSTPKKILLFEDENALSKIASAKLRLAGYEVRVLENGVGAIESIAADTPDLILLDLGMPQVDGFSVLKMLKAHATFHAITVLVLSNLSQEADVDAVLALGAEEFLIKSDTSLSQVLKVVQKYLGDS